MGNGMNGHRVTLTGAMAGALGGLAGSWVMRLGQSALEGPRGERNQRSPQGMREQHAAAGDGSSEQPEQDPTVKIVTMLWHALLRREPGQEQKRAGGTLVHYVFGSAVGALYGAAAQIFPAAATGLGIPFGTAVWLGADLVALPMLGLSRPPSQVPPPAHTRMLGLHVAYGLTTGLVYRALLRTADLP